MYRERDERKVKKQSHKHTLNQRSRAHRYCTNTYMPNIKSMSSHKPFKINTAKINFIYIMCVSLSVSLARSRSLQSNTYRWSNARATQHTENVKNEKQQQTQSKLSWLVVRLEIVCVVKKRIHGFERGG